ncbi:MAG: UDP-N-acetylmuramyl tripeptide synthase [Parcubacteria group bacterium GW2011_GWA2_40_23]|nr:MAG: UDP-N-acetylmuramyl tripeptide synthase [Parcubacteria group bacterium GW2011_GWA2_40_23]
MNKNLKIIKDAVLEMGGKIEEFVPERGCFYIKVLGKRILLERKISISRQSFVSGSFTRCKDITHKLLESYNLPSPATECFYNKSFDKRQALKQVNKLSFPIILKDSTGSQSIGIFPFIETPREAVMILGRELPKYRGMVAQEMVFGKEYRILVLGEKVIGALEMIPPFIVGNGVSTIRKIITAKQNTTDRRTDFDKKLNKILKDQNVTLETILAKKKLVFIKKSSCLAEGGETSDATDQVHPDVVKMCVAASKAVGKYLVGIDVICENISEKPSKKNFHILEINGKPDLYIHYNPTHGKTKNVVKDIVKFMAKVANPLPAKD